MFDQPSRQRPNRRGAVAAVIALAAGAIVGGVFGAMWLRHGSQEPGSGEAAWPFSGSPSSAGTTGRLAAYQVGTCLYEVPGGSPGSVTLRTAECGSNAAVFVVNHVVSEKSDCARFADYNDYGLVQADNSARAVYCLSLAVPAQGCVYLAGGSAPQRADCGSGHDTRRVGVIRRSTHPATACSDLPGADPWYDRSPDSRRIACLVKNSG